MFFVRINYNTFFNIEEIYRFCKTLSFYNNKEYREKIERDPGTWAGYRTDDFRNICPLLYSFVIEKLVELKIKVNKYKEISMYCHVRLETDKDLENIHVDHCDTSLIYLSPTNLNSGTCFYDDNNNKVANCAFLQNTTVSFSKGILHSSINHYGNSIENGRMTINVFMFD